MSRLRFGGFMAPFHLVGENPTPALERDLQLMEHLDACGYVESWIGEHSAGSELISSPEIFIAAAAERTRSIRLGTGASSLSHHNPLWVADRMMLHDHLTRGRMMLEVGPGSLPTDSAMIGLNPTDTRELLAEYLDIVLRLLAGESVTATTRTHTLIDARLQLRPRSEPLFDITVPSWPPPPGPDWPASTGSACSPSARRCHRTGSTPWPTTGTSWKSAPPPTAPPSPGRTGGWSGSCTSPRPANRPTATSSPASSSGSATSRRWRRSRRWPFEGGDVKEMINFINEAGIGAIGTVEDARKQVQRLQSQSGGFGAMLLLTHEWANPEATNWSYELIAQHVMPQFQGSGRTHAQSTIDAKAGATSTREGHAQTQLDAVATMTQRYADEVAATV